VPDQKVRRVQLLRQKRRGVIRFLRHIQTRNIDLEENLDAQPRTIENQFGRTNLCGGIELDALNLHSLRTDNTSGKLVVDEAKVASFIRRAVEEESYAVDVCGDGAQGLDLARAGCYDLIILDLMLPGMPGLEVLKALRKEQVAAPVLILTARSELDQKVKGLDAGADDYLTKPFAIEELVARVRALLRRGTGEAAGVLQVDDLVLNPATREVTRGGKRIELTAKEYALLEYLMRNAGRVLTRPMIAEHVWNQDFDTFTNVIDVYVNYLRNKIDRGQERKLIQTVRGSGYTLKAD